MSIQQTIDLLDELNVPLHTDTRQAAQALAEAGHPVAPDTVRYALTGRICRQLARQAVA